MKGHDTIKEYLKDFISISSEMDAIYIKNIISCGAADSIDYFYHGTGHWNLDRLQPNKNKKYKDNMSYKGDKKQVEKSQLGVFT